MKRREFVEKVSLGSAMALTGGALGKSDTTAKKALTDSSTFAEKTRQNRSDR